MGNPLLTVVVGQVGVAASPLRTNAQCQAKFVSLVRDKDIHEGGQFGWYYKLNRRAWEWLDGALSPGSYLRSRLLEIPMVADREAPTARQIALIPALFMANRMLVSARLRSDPGRQAAVDLAERIRAGVEEMIEKEINAQRGQPGEAEVRSFLTSGSEGAGSSLHDKATSKLNQGQLCIEGDPDATTAANFTSLFDTKEHKSQLAIRGLHAASMPKCFALVNGVIGFLNQQNKGPTGGGMWGPKIGGPKINAEVHQGATKHDTSTPDLAAFGQLVKYRPQFPTDIEDARRSLSNGYVIRTGVLSGLIAEKGVGDPDHWMLLIGFEADRFCFWDPDAAVTHKLALGFGEMIFIDGPNAKAGSRFGDLFKNGRLTTARPESELSCVDVWGGHYRTSPTIEKRYQVTHMSAM